MARPDVGTENPLIASFFSADPGGPGLTLEQLKSRRAIAAALAAKSRDYPNTIGKGIFSLGESIGEVMRDSKLDAAEKRMLAGDREAMEKNRKLLEPSPDAATPPPIGPPGPAAAPAARAELDPEVDLSRAQMAEALVGGAQGSQGAGPGATRMAALPAMDTMSDAGQPGLTYGGPSPAGPGASMAERPDQAPPAPSAPPAGMAGPGPADTPAPMPVAGGGVAPPPQPMPGGGVPPGLPPGVDAARAGMAQQIAGANQAFNPDAAGPAGPPGVPPQMLAQVGGFGAGGASPFPAPPPGGAPPGATTGGPLPPGAPGAPLPPGGVRPDTSLFTPPTEAEYVRQYGPRAVAPSPWPNPELRERYNRALEESRNDYRGEAYRQTMRDAAARIKEENDKIFKQKEDLFKQQVTQEGTQFGDLYKRSQAEFDERRDPAKIAARDQTIADHQLSLRAGNIPAAEVHKELKTDQDHAKATAKRLEDYQIALDAMKNGVFVGYGATTRLDASKLGAWLTNNEQLSKRAGSTELLRAKLLSTVNDLVKDIKPISNIDIMLGKSQAGDINMEPSALDALLRQTMQRSYRDLATYDSKAHSLVNGLGTRSAPGELTPLEARYKSPEATWFRPHQLERFFANPTSIENFNKTYGPGAGEFVLNRKKLNPSARPPDTP